MLTTEQVKQFKRDGFINGGLVLADEEVETLRSEITRVMDGGESLDRKPVLSVNLKGGDAPVWQIVNIWEASDAFQALIANPQITSDIALLTGARELRIWHDQILYKPAETGGVNWWHQDAPLWPILQPMTEVSAWIAMDDVNEENGCMSMVPGSHLWGNNIDYFQSLNSFNGMPAEFKGHKVNVKLCPVRKGEVHYHHALTWHGSHENQSGRPRRAVALHYMTQDTRYLSLIHI